MIRNGIGQLTTGMHTTDTSLSAHGKIKVAVDYEDVALAKFLDGC